MDPRPRDSGVLIVCGARSFAMYFPTCYLLLATHYTDALLAPATVWDFCLRWRATSPPRSPPRCRVIQRLTSARPALGPTLDGNAGSRYARADWWKQQPVLRCYGERRVSPRSARRKKNIPVLSHKEVADLLVDYHFGRLSPSMNAAVEAHVRSCPNCKRQGLDHAVTEKRVIQRKLRHVRPFRHLVSRRRRPLFLLLALLVLFQLVIFEVVRPDSPFAALLGGAASATATATALPSRSATP